MNEAPKLMRALMLEGPSLLSVKEVPIPKPNNGEVLIKVMAAPINPSDVIFLKLGVYAGDKKVPCIPGFQGSGVVVQNGGGLIGWGLVNKKVAFTPIPSSGTYAQYAIAKSGECLPVDDSMSFEHASMSFVNPLTAMAMLDYTKQKKAKAVIVNAAASSLGRMLNRFLPPQGIEIINIVRRQEQAQILKKIGATHVLNSQDPNFQQNLKNLATQLEATVCFDAIGGTMTSLILTCMPAHSILYIYGLLSGQNINDLSVRELIYGHKTVTGLFLPHWLSQKGIVKLLPTMIKLRKLLLKQLSSEIATQCSLDQFQASLKGYLANMTKGKIVLKPYSENKQPQQEKKMEEKQ